MNGPMLFGKYCLLERISVGGMAEVFRAKPFFGIDRNNTEKYYAIKRLFPHLSEQKEFLQMFIDEAELTVQLHHPHIARVYELGQFQSAHYLVMEYLASHDLLAIQQHLRRQKTTMAIAQACMIARAMASALDYVHKKCDDKGNPLHIIHRDISPQNVLIGYDGSIKLIDFGIAKSMHQHGNTQTGVLKGKIGYLSPEQVTGEEVDHRSDVFALGIVFWEMLTNRRLFQADHYYETMDQIRRGEIHPPSTINSAVDMELDNIIMRTLARDSEQRFQSGSELLVALNHYFGRRNIRYDSENLKRWMRVNFQHHYREEQAKLERFKTIRTPDDVSRLLAEDFPARDCDDDQVRWDATQMWDVSILPESNEDLDAFVATHTIIQAGGIGKNQ